MRIRRVLAASAAVLVAGAAVAASAWGASGPELISVTSSGAQLSADVYDGTVDDNADRVVFVDPFETSENASHVYVRDRSAGTTKKVYTSPLGRNAYADISGSGRYVAISIGSSLRVRAIDSGTTQWLRSFATIGEPSISVNGRWVAFAGRTSADGPRHAYRWNLVTGGVTQVSHRAGVGDVEISGDGRKVAYAIAGHAYLKTVSTGALEQVDQGTSGEPGNSDNVILGGVSRDGRYVSFTSGATNLVDGSEVCETIEGGCVFRRDTTADTSVVASVLPDGEVSNNLYISTISADGNVVVFSDEQAYARDLSSGTTERVSENASGVGANRGVETVSVDADGSHVAFTTPAGNLGASGAKLRVWLGPTEF